MNDFNTNPPDFDPSSLLEPQGFSCRRRLVYFIIILFVVVGLMGSTIVTIVWLYDRERARRETAVATATLFPPTVIPTRAAQTPTPDATIPPFFTAINRITFINPAGQVETVDPDGKNGRLLTVGNTSGPKFEFDNRLMFGKHLSIIGSTMGTSTDYATVMNMIFDGRLQPVIDSVYPLSEGIAALQRLEKGEMTGKIVLTR